MGHALGQEHASFAFLQAAYSNASVFAQRQPCSLREAFWNLPEPSVNYSLGTLYFFFFFLALTIIVIT